MQFHVINIIDAALPTHAQTEKTTFSCKDDCTLTKHTQRWTYSARDFEIPLCHAPPLWSFFFKDFKCVNDNFRTFCFLIRHMFCVSKIFNTLLSLSYITPPLPFSSPASPSDRSAPMTMLICHRLLEMDNVTLIRY